MHAISRRSAVMMACAAVIAALSFSPASAQSDFPSRTITLLVPLQAATASDLVARVIAQNFSERAGKSMIVEIVVGGGGAIGAQRVARAHPDGYTIGPSTTAFTRSCRPRG
jgi:tripartite-type tricarboxylate transporter receptor subunit TctC